MSSFLVYLDSHDHTTGDVFHLLYHSISSPPQLLNLLQVIRLHYKVLHGVVSKKLVPDVQHRNQIEEQEVGFTRSPIVTQALESRSRGGLGTENSKKM